MGFLIREATVADAERLGYVNVTSWRQAYAHFLSPAFLAELSTTELVERWQRGLERSTTGVFVAEVDGTVVGYSAAGRPREEDAPRDLELQMIYLLASEHGSGSGQALLDAAVGSTPAFLWVAELNPRAQAFYRRNGFEPDGARKVEPRWDNLAEIRMVR